MSLNIAETCIYTTDLDEAEKFYSDLMGLQLLKKDDERHLFYKCNNGMLLIFNPHHTLNMKTEVNSSPVPLHGAKGPGHLAFSVESDNYNEWKEKLTNNGIEIESEIVWTDDVRSFYFRDPAGNSLEIIAGNMWDFT